MLKRLPDGMHVELETLELVSVHPPQGDREFWLVHLVSDTGAGLGYTTVAFDREHEARAMAAELQPFCKGGR